MPFLPGSPGIKLIGELQVKGNNWDLNAFSSLFGKLAKEVKHSDDLTRYIGYEGVAGRHCDVRFFGVEVSCIEHIPDGMVALELRDSNFTVCQSENGQNIIVWQDDLTWQWFDRSPYSRYTGEFSAKCPCEWNSQAISSQYNFHITSNAYFAPDRKCDDDVCLVDYNSSWPQQYEEMKYKLQKLLRPDIALRIEHYGSTSIPEMSAKPVIDILVEIPSFDDARKYVIPLLNNPECEYWFYSDHMIFIIRKEFMGQRTHHIHMAPADHRIWNGLAFRDYLKTHPKDAARYASLKYNLAKRHQTDRERYTAAKEEFIQEILVKALQEY